MSEKILNLTLEILCLLTGEDYTVVKRTSGNVIPCSCTSGEWGGIQRPILKASPHSLIQRKSKKQKILELTSKIIELLTGEVPVRCQDVTVHFSMEEWEYFEGHKYLYKDIMMEDHQPLISPVGVGSKDENEELDTCGLSQSYLKDEDGEINGNVQGIAEESNSYSVEDVEITTITQYPSINIDEKPSCDGRNLPLSNDPVDRTIDKPWPCNEGTIYTLMDQIPQYTCTHIKEEPISCDGGNLADPNIYTPNTQHHSTTYIKEEQTTSDDPLTDPNSYTITDHRRYIFTHTKKKQVLNESETLTDLNIYTLTDHTQNQFSHTKEEPDSYHGENSFTSTDHIQHYPTTHIKEEQALCDDNLKDPNIYTPNRQHHSTTYIKEEQTTSDDPLTDPNSYTITDHRQYIFTHTKKKQVLKESETLRDLNIYTPTDHTQNLSSHTKEEPDSYHGENSFRSTDHTHYPTTHIKEEQALCDDNLKDTNSYTLTDHIKQCSITDIKEEQALREEDLTDCNSSTTTDHTKYLFSHIKKEPVSSNNVNLTDLNIHVNADSIQQYGFTHVMNKPGFYDGENLTNPDSTTSTEHTQQYPTMEKAVLENVSALQKQDLFSSGKPLENKKEPEQNHNDISVSSKKYFCTIQQTTDSLEILYNCPECPECFTSNLDLAKHQIIHTEDMPFICSVCGRCFGRKSDLIIHKITHGEHNDFGCPHCDLSFASMSSLSIHEKSHVEKKLLPCPECGKTFPTKKRLTGHRQIHTDKRPFKCHQCGDRFKRKGHLQRHQTIHEKAKQMRLN